MSQAEKVFYGDQEGRQTKGTVSPEFYTGGGRNMFVWMKGLLDVSRAFYTESQREYFFGIVNQLYRRRCVQAAHETFPEDDWDEIEEQIRQGREVEEWWGRFAGPESDMEEFAIEKVRKAVFDDLRANIDDYVEQTCSLAPEEKPEEWYKCSFVKSLLHEFVNDRKSPLKITVHLSDKETALLTHTVCWILVSHFRRTLHMQDEDAEYMMKLLYCGEFAQNDWLNLVCREKVRKIRRGVTEQFIYAFLAGKYNCGMDPASFSDFIHEEMMTPLYMAIYNARDEIMAKSREYWEEHTEDTWLPFEMESFCRYITDHVDLDIEGPRMDLYLQDAEQDPDRQGAGPLLNRSIR